MENQSALESRLLQVQDTARSLARDNEAAQTIINAIPICFIVPLAVALVISLILFIRRAVIMKKQGGYERDQKLKKKILKTLAADWMKHLLLFFMAFSAGMVMNHFFVNKISIPDLLKLINPSIPEMTLNAVPVSDDVELSWTEMPDAAIYLVYHAEGRVDDPAEMNRIECPSLGYVHEHLTKGAFYSYQVEALDAHGSVIGRSDISRIYLASTTVTLRPQVTAMVTATARPTATATAAWKPTATATATATQKPTATATATATQKPTARPTPGHVTVSQSNPDYKYRLLGDGTAEISDYTGNASQLVIPDMLDGCRVSSVGAEAFYNYDDLTSISIPSNVVSIGDSAFEGCYRLTSISIPSSVTSIGDSVFAYCDALTNISIPNSVTSISNWAFYDCDALTSLSIPSGVTSVGDYAFCNCDALNSVSIPSSVTSIGDWAFAWCSGLTSISIPSSVSSIGDSAFVSCDGLTSISIPSSVTSIGDWAFRDCPNLTLSVPRGSYAETYAKKNSIPYTIR